MTEITSPVTRALLTNSQINLDSNLLEGQVVVEEVEEIDEEKHPEAFAVFRRELTDFAVDLAKLVVRDGEGATKFVTVTVKVRTLQPLSLVVPFLIR